MARNYLLVRSPSSLGWFINQHPFLRQIKQTRFSLRANLFSYYSFLNLLKELFNWDPGVEDLLYDEDLLYEDYPRGPKDPCY